MRKPPIYPGNGQAGFSLLEVLIALVILSVGLLGIAALISSSLKTNDSAYMRSQATSLAYNIIDRMRANLSTAQNGGYNFSLGTAAPGSTTACNGSGAGCSGPAVATYDLSQWATDLGIMLPQGQGAVTTAQVTNNGVTTYTTQVTVRWNDTRAASAIKVGTAPPPAVTYAYVVISSAL